MAHRWIYLLCILLSPFLEAKETVGTVLEIRGVALADKKGLYAEDALYSEEIIEVQEGGLLKLSLTDGTQITLIGKSCFEVLQYIYQTRKTSLAVVKLFSGTCTIATGEIAREALKDFRIDTPLASIEALRSHLVISLKDTRLDVGCLQGCSLISNSKGNLFIGKGYAIDYASVTRLANLQSSTNFVGISQIEEEEKMIMQERERQVGAPEPQKRASKEIKETLRKTRMPQAEPLEKRAESS